MSWFLLLLGVVSVALVINAMRPVTWPAAAGLVSFMLGWTTADLPVLQVMIQGVIAVALVGQGALDAWPGWLGLALLVSAWGGLLRAHDQAHRAEDAMEEALAKAGVISEREPWMARSLLLPFPITSHPTVAVERGVEMGRQGRWVQRADVFYPRNGVENAPVMVFVHGGGWVVAFKQFQGLPVMRRLVERGWVCISVSYRLSPWVAFPDHLVDVKRGIAWAKEHAHRWGGNPKRFFAMHGNSAGAHLSALAVMTSDQARYQPGFEDVDTQVDACVPVYGPMDLRNRRGAWGPDFGWFLRLLVVRVASDHPLWTEASPIDQIKSGLPPFFVLHGSADTLVPVSESHGFVEKMRTAGNHCDYVEIPGGQHALDVFHSRRGVVAADGIARWLEHRREQHELGASAEETASLA